jgi:hypothetical protein
MICPAYLESMFVGASVRNRKKRRMNRQPSAIAPASTIRQLQPHVGSSQRRSAAVQDGFDDFIHNGDEPDWRSCWAW